MPISRIKTDGIQDDAITSAKIGVDVIVADDLAANSVTVSEITDGAVTGAKLANNLNYGSGTLYLDSSSGNVGIGTSSPTFAAGGGLNVVNGTFATIRARCGSSTGIDFAQDTSSNGYLYNRDNSSIIFGTNNAERMRLDSSGRLGVNVTSLSKRLSVGVPLSDTDGLALVYDADPKGGILLNPSSGEVRMGAINSSGTYFTTLYANNSEALRIDSSGNVGIGTTNPSTFGKLAIQVDGTTTPTTANNVKGSSVNLYAATNGSSTNSTVGIFGWQASQPGIGSGIGFSRENAVDWGSQIRFYTHPTTTSNISDITERMRITADGNVGIGINSPQELLHIDNASGDAAVRIDGSTRSFKIEQNNYGLRFVDVDAGSAERMRITAGGDINYHTSGSFKIYRFNSSTNPYLNVGSIGCAYFNASSTDANAYAIVTNKDSSSTMHHICFKNINSVVGTISTSGSSTSYNTSSDHRLKENVVEMTDATTRLKQLQPKRFNFIADADTTVDGFLAHEVQDIVPEAITGTHNEVDDDGNPVYQGIDQSKLVPLLVKTIQELEARITALESN